MKAPNLDGVPDCLPLYRFGAHTRQQASRISLLSPTSVWIGRESRRLHVPSSKWCNPYKVSAWGRNTCISKFQDMIVNNADLLKDIGELSGRTLACACRPDQACHADVLISEFLKQSADLPELSGNNLHFLLLFSGPSSRKDSIAAYLRELGTCLEVDVGNDTVS